ncbi:hypothetical protein SAMN05216316_0463 [Nitrosovibrio sp. Nv6]|nr:hypothetical protein SAMN05216316_0463 [Nitrosovibrio sp. Nv6]
MIIIRISQLIPELGTGKYSHLLCLFNFRYTSSDVMFDILCDNAQKKPCKSAIIIKGELKLKKYSSWQSSWEPHRSIKFEEYKK